MTNNKIAIIGAAHGQLPLCLKARQMGLETHCFAWEKGAVCRDAVDHFYPISIVEKDRIVDECRRIGVAGVVSNAADLPVETASYVAGRLGLTGTPYDLMVRLADKHTVRQLTCNIEELSRPACYRYDGRDRGLYPVVVKPCQGSGKRGVSFAGNAAEFAQAVRFAQTDAPGTDLLVEQYIPGREVSVESISCQGRHYVVQVTDKVSGPAPHFVELAHHQPARLSPELRQKIERVVPRVLSAIGFTDGATHLELRLDGNSIYLIEVNLRGGGDEISSRLTRLSTGVDYLRAMIEVAMGSFAGIRPEHEPRCSGIYFLTKQTEWLLPHFRTAGQQSWCVECKFDESELVESRNNWQRNGYLIYQADHRVELEP